MQNTTNTNDAASARWRLHGIKAVVLGASHGIGRAIAEEYLELGAEVLAVGREIEPLASFRDAQAGRSGTLHVLSADCTTDDGLRALVSAVETGMRGVDVLVCNVGGNTPKAATGYAREDIEQIFGVNVTSTLAACQALHPLLVRRGGGSIIFMGSIAASRSVRTGAAYGAAKAALGQLCRSLADEWGSDNIRVNVIAPSFTRTRRIAPLLEDEAYRAHVESMTPLGRVATPADISGLAAFLAMPAAAFISGQVIAVDGGFLARGLLRPPPVPRS